MEGEGGRRGREGEREGRREGGEGGREEREGGDLSNLCTYSLQENHSLCQVWALNVPGYSITKPRSQAPPTQHNRPRDM